MALRLTLSRSAERAKKYFKESLSREDYYREGPEVVGRWGGDGARMLGLEGAVSEADFGALAENRDPISGYSLTQRTRDNRRVGFDFTFSVPKSVSLHQALFDDPEVERSFQDAVSETMRELESDMETRVRRQGAHHDRRTGNMVWASFTHRTARPVKSEVADPHLHAHVFVFNATWDAREELWKAGEFSKLHHRRPYWEAVFHNRLSQKLRDLGYEVERTAQNFELKGYAKPTLKKFSQRTRQIEREAKRKGISHPKQKAALGARTRGSKQKNVSPEQLRESWWSRLSPEEQGSVRCVRPTRRPARPSGVRDIVERAMEFCFERQSVVTRDEFLTRVLKLGVAETRPEAARAALAEAASDGRLISAVWEGEEVVTTPEVQLEEEGMLATIRQGRERWGPLCSPPGGTWVLPSDLPEDWVAAAREMLSSRDQATMLIGKPGTGKTTVMKTVAGALAAAGTEVHAFAPSARASRENQRRAGFGKAETLAMLFGSEERQEAARGHVIWVDEAGMVGARDMRRLLELSDRLEARLILTGDPNQHKPVDRGDAMRILEDFGGIEPVRLNVIRRQTEESYRRAATEIAEGKIADGFDRLVEMEAVIEVEDWEERSERIAEDYVRQRVDRAKSVVVVSPTHHEGREVSAAIREALQDRGVVSREERTEVRWSNKGWQTSEKRDPAMYAVGDKVKFHKGAPGFMAGQSATVVGRTDQAVEVERPDGASMALPLDHAERFDVFAESRIALAAGDELRITRNGFAKSTDPAGRKQRLSNGKLYRLDGFTEAGDLILHNGMIVDRDYATLDHGYVVTSHTAQSLDEDVVLVAQSHTSFRASSSEQFLVSVTRGREAVRVYTDDREALREVVHRSASRVSATELAASGQSLDPDTREASRIAQLRDWLLERARRAASALTSREVTLDGPIAAERGGADPVFEWQRRR